MQQPVLRPSSGIRQPLGQINEFELRLHERRGIVTGEFAKRTAVPGGGAQGLASEGPRFSILNGKIFGDRACFDVTVEHVEMRWYVTAHGNKLSGTWSEGPEGGPIQEVPGVRFCESGGRKVAR